MGEAPLKGRHDLPFAESVAPRPPNGQNEGKPEPVVVGGIEPADVLELFGGAMGEPGLALFVR